MWIHASRKLLPFICAIALLSACGGGGGGGDGGGGGGGGGQTPPPASADDELAIAPALLALSYVERGQDIAFAANGGPAVEVTATFAADPPSGDVFVFVLQGEPVVTRVTFVQASGDGRKSHWSVDFNPDLAAGKYEGNLDLRVCADAACSAGQRSWQVTVPYQVTVKPGIQLDVLVNGKRVTDRPVKARDGDILSMSASTPLAWFREWSSGAFPDVTEETGTTWRAVARYSVSTPGNTGRFAFSAESKRLGARETVTFEVRE